MAYLAYGRVSFPDKIDEFDYMQDVTSELYTAAKSYDSNMQNGNILAAQQILDIYPTLKQCVFDANKYNKMVDAIMSLETFFRDQVHTYVTSFIVDRGVWNANVTDYRKYNIVRSSAGVPYFALKDVLSTKQPLSNTSYWMAMGIKGDKGDKGDKGTSMVYQGVYNASTAYQSLNVVLYGDKMYISISGSTGIVPTNTAYWVCISSVSYTIDTSLSTESGNPVQNKVVTNKLNELSGSSHTHTNKGVLDNITSENVHVHSNKSALNKITDSKITAWDNMLPKSMIESSTSDITAGVTRLDTGKLYIVYE